MGSTHPSWKSFERGYWDDESSPGILALGDGYHVTFPLAKAGGGLSSALAGLHNRCVSSAFAQGADYLVRSVVGQSGSGVELSQSSRQRPSALSQARDINQLPTLAEALLPTRQAPWHQTSPALLAPPACSITPTP
jgi:hypothetical protein